MGLSPEVVRAEQADAAGQHTAPIDHLVTGTRRNDVEVTTRLGGVPDLFELRYDGGERNRPVF